jgi:hypothetical protein
MTYLYQVRNAGQFSRNTFSAAIGVPSFCMKGAA